MDRTVECITKGEMAYRRIRDMIVDGRLAAGQAVGHQAISKQLAVSNAPVIDALRRLEAEGLLERRPHSSAHVKMWNAREYIQRLMMREALESITVRWCIKTITDEQIKQLEQLCKQVDNSSGQKKNGVSPIELDSQFHLLIAQLSGLKVFEEELRRIDLCNRAMRRDAKFPPFREQPPAVAQHYRIFAAIAARDPERSEQALREHLREARQWLAAMAENLKLLEKREYMENGGENRKLVKDEVSEKT